MKFDPVPFNPPNRKPVGRFTAQLSPDGWVESMYENTPGAHLSSAEVMESSRFINSFIHSCGSQDVFQKYVKKHGEQIDNVTSVVFYHGSSLDFVVMVTGYAVAIAIHRKENA